MQEDHSSPQLSFLKFKYWSLESFKILFAGKLTIYLILNMKEHFLMI